MNTDECTCSVCNKPYVTIPQAIIAIQIDHFHYSGGEGVCWGRGDCAKAIIAAEHARRAAEPQK